METWVKLEEFAKIASLEKEKILEMVANGELKSQEKDGQVLIDAGSGTSALVKTNGNAILLPESSSGVDSDFVEKTIGTILNLHEKVVSSKEETILSVKNENQFLKDALFNTQEVYEDDKKTIATLREQLKAAQEEIEFLKRKYRLMWGKVVSGEAQSKGETDEEPKQGEGN